MQGKRLPALHAISPVPKLEILISRKYKDVQAMGTVQLDLFPLSATGFLSFAFEPDPAMLQAHTWELILGSHQETTI